MTFRITYWITILIILFTSTIVHVRLLIVVLSNRKNPSYSSIFFKMFISQLRILQLNFERILKKTSIIEIFFVYSYAFCDMTLRDSLLGDDFALNSGYIFPMFAYYGTYYFTVHSQGAVMISVNRYVTVCRPVSKMARLYDRIEYPVLCSINFLELDIYYYHIDTGDLTLYTPMASVKTNSLQGMIVSVIGSLICAACYFLVIWRLASAHRAPKGDLRDYGREKILTIVGFALFLAVCASTLIYVLISANAAKDSNVLPSIGGKRTIDHYNYTFVEKTLNCL
uniref:G protein-coupled receptor n=1 Tax=Pristionchus pacificus TaxID=54126 RepID=A0A8R1UUX4_PRIPA